MLVTISWPRFAQLLRELNNLPADTSDDELEVRLSSYARKAFDYAAEAYGIRIGNLSSPATKSVAEFNADISGTRDQFEPEVWGKLIGGLQFLRAIAVTVERQDLWTICDGLVAKAMNDSFGDYRDSLRNLSVEELQPHFEAWCQKIAWGTGENSIWNDTTLREISFKAAAEEVGVQDPMAYHDEVEAYRREEEAAIREATGKLGSSWGVVGPDGQRY